MAAVSASINSWKILVGIERRETGTTIFACFSFFSYNFFCLSSVIFFPQGFLYHVIWRFRNFAWWGSHGWINAWIGRVRFGWNHEWIVCWCLYSNWWAMQWFSFSLILIDLIFSLIFYFLVFKFISKITNFIWFTYLFICILWRLEIYWQSFFVWIAIFSFCFLTKGNFIALPFFSFRLSGILA